MKKIILLLLALSFYISSEAQVKFGIMTGTSPNHIDVGAVESNILDDSLLVTLTGPRTAWLAGPYLRLQARFIYVQSSVMLGFSPIDYDVDDLKTGGNIVKAQRDKEWYFDVPIELGLKIYKGFSVTGGVMGTNNFVEEQINPFLDIDDTFLDIFRDRKFGYRFGLNYDNSWTTTLSLSYTNFPSIPSTVILYDNVEYTSNIRQHQIMVNFGWNFIRAGWDD